MSRPGARIPILALAVLLLPTNASAQKSSFVANFAGTVPPATLNRVLSNLTDDEAWGDLGDAYSREGNRLMATGCWAVAQLIDPDDSEWTGHQPDLSRAAWAIEALNIVDDEWVGDLGDAAANAGWTLAAENLYRRALALDPDDSEWISKAGRTPTGSSSGYGSASSAAASRVRSNLNDDEAWGDLGDEYSRSGDRSMAEGAWAVARILDPDDSEWSGHGPDLDLAAYAIERLGVTDDEWVGDLGDAADRLGWGSAAQALFRRALALDPDDGEWIGKVRTTGSKSSGTIGRSGAVNLVPARTVNAVRANLRDDEAWGDLGDAFSNAGIPEAAEGAWSVARILDQDDGEWSGHAPELTYAPLAIEELGITDDEWVGDLADLANGAGWDAAAQALYRLALRLDPDDGEWIGKYRGGSGIEPNPDYYRDSDSYAVSGGVSREIVDRVLAAPNDDEAWGDLGDAYARIGDSWMADGAWGAALLLDPDDAEWIGHDPDLNRVWLLVERLNIRDDEWVGDLGDAAMARGDREAALGLYRRALDLDPDDSEWISKARGG